jgi:hypothetical protein
LRVKSKVATGEEADELRRELEYAQRLATYQRQGLSDEEATIRAMRVGVELEELRATALLEQDVARRGQRPAGGSGVSSVARFAEGAGLGRTSGSGAALAGIVTGVAVAGGTDVVAQAAPYGQQIKDFIGADRPRHESGSDLPAAAKQAGATNEQLTAAFAHLNDAIGCAKDGDTSLQISTLALAAISAQAASAQAPTSWRINGDIGGKSFVEDCRFNPDGAKLSGTCVDVSTGDKSIKAGKIHPVTRGSACGNRMTWTYQISMFLMSLNVDYDGRVSGNQMSGTLSVRGHQGKFTATRQDHGARAEICFGLLRFNETPVIAGANNLHTTLLRIPPQR